MPEKDSVFIKHVTNNQRGLLQTSCRSKKQKVLKSFRGGLGL